MSLTMIIGTERSGGLSSPLEALSCSCRSVTLLSLCHALVALSRSCRLLSRFLAASCTSSSDSLHRATMYFGNYGVPSTPFEQNYRCYSASFIDKAHLENGDKVVMPPSALDRLASLRIDYPMLFEVHNPSTLRTSHCGVLEFVAEEGMIYMPYWVMQNMLLQEGDMVRVKSATLPKGTFVKLQPHTKDFLDISNPKAVLETTLRNFSCLTVGDNIMVAYNNKKYYIDIIESMPANAISIIETDCEVDFAPPLDYKEPERFTPPPLPVPVPSSSQDATPDDPAEPKFNAFTGTGRRLDGKSGRHSTGSISVTTSTTTPSAAISSVPSPTRTPPAGTPPARPAGKLVFGGGSSNGAGPVAAKGSIVKKEEVKGEKKGDEEPKFQAFTGRKYLLRD